MSTRIEIARRIYGRLYAINEWAHLVGRGRQDLWREVRSGRTIGEHISTTGRADHVWCTDDQGLAMIGDCGFVGTTLWRIRHFHTTAGSIMSWTAFMFHETSGQFLWVFFHLINQASFRRICTAAQLEAGVRAWKERRVYRRRILASVLPATDLLSIVWSFL